MNNLICKISKDDIRKAYFEGKLKKLLNTFQSNKPTEEDTKQLSLFLDSLRKEDLKFIEEIKNNYKGVLFEEDIIPPTSDKLYTQLSEKEKEKFNENLDIARKKIRDIRFKVANSTNKASNITKDDYSNFGLEIETWRIWIYEDYINKEQLYIKRIIDLMDKGLKKGEAEYRAKLTLEYKNYKLAKDNLDNLREVMLLCKKRSGNDF